MPPVTNNELELIAYVLDPSVNMPLVKAPRERSWMSNTTDAFARRCLPLMIANQAGWFLLNEHSCYITWNGGNATTDIMIEYPNTPSESVYGIQSHFGFGIITWTVPYLFRTSPGYNLLVRGPANWPKQDCYPLEGLVETDWATATFTVNWKLTRPNTCITFEKEEPICMLVPQRRHELEQIHTHVCVLMDDYPELEQEYEHWANMREQFLATQPSLETLGKKGQEFQKHYLRGETTTGIRAVDHQTKLRLNDFLSQDKSIDTCNLSRTFSPVFSSGLKGDEDQCR